MLKAINQESDYVYAWDEIKNNDIKYNCPECNSPVLLRKCQDKIDHFAHKKKVNCSLSKGETIQHLKMKEHVFKLISTNFKKYSEYIDHGLEKKLIDGRIADIFVNFKNHRLVLECQHSPISEESLVGRLNDYTRNDIFLVWIFCISRTKRDDFYEKTGRVLIPHELQLMEKLFDEVYVMDEQGNLRSCTFSRHRGRKYVFFEKIGFQEMCVRVVNRTKQLIQEYRKEDIVDNNDFVLNVDYEIGNPDSYKGIYVTHRGEKIYQSFGELGFKHDYEHIMYEAFPEAYFESRIIEGDSYESFLDEMDDFGRLKYFRKQ